MEYTSKITDGNRLVIPQSLLDELDIHTGDTVSLKVQDGTICVVPSSAQHAQELVRRYAVNRPKGSVVDEFLQEKRLEAAREASE
jgi:antitoxin component of MazEF toxin-antitoxin module